MNIVERVITTIILTAFLATPSIAQVPDRPNETDPAGLRQGLWSFLLDEDWKIVSDISEASFFRTAHFVDGKPKGLVTDYYMSGRKKSEGHMLSIDPDVYEGQCRWFYENGFPEWIVTYGKGKKEGVETGYFKNGRKKAEFSYKAGKVDGVCTTWYENGRKEWAIPYKDDIVEGYAVGWFEDGKKKIETHYVHGKKNGMEVEFFASGPRSSETPYKNGLKHGVIIDFFPNGIMKREMPVLNGVQDGVEIGRYENGDKMYMIPYKNGMKHGEARVWDKDGKLFTRIWENGVAQE